MKKQSLKGKQDRIFFNFNFNLFARNRNIFLMERKVLVSRLIMARLWKRLRMRKFVSTLHIPTPDKSGDIEIGTDTDLTTSQSCYRSAVQDYYCRCFALSNHFWLMETLGMRPKWSPKCPFLKSPNQLRQTQACGSFTGQLSLFLYPPQGVILWLHTDVPDVPSLTTSPRSGLVVENPVPQSKFD